jgi:hypothetical protein
MTVHNVHDIRRMDMLRRRSQRLFAAFKSAPDTGHQPGHKYPPRK